jgi:hypothetical protein
MSAIRKFDISVMLIHSKPCFTLIHVRFKPVYQAVLIYDSSNLCVMFAKSDITELCVQPARQPNTIIRHTDRQYYMRQQMNFSMHEFRGRNFQPLSQSLKAANLKKKGGGGNDVNFVSELGTASTILHSCSIAERKRKKKMN